MHNTRFRTVLQCRRGADRMRTRALYERTAPMKHLTALTLSLAILAGAAGASAGSGLQSEQDINEGLLALAVADKIRRSCGGIGGRLFKARGFANDLKSVAELRGYSRSEIDAYLNDDHEKAKMRERRNAYFQDQGASNLDSGSLCALGHHEIAKKSLIGELLKAK